jgi:hypothetical protein
VTEGSAPEAGSSPRPLGEILLEHGFVTQEQLDHAVDAQERTGKPLGQVLVEAGSLTRLELASALAEQWSNTGSWLGVQEDDSSPSWPDAPQLDRAGDDPLAALAESRLETRLQAVETALQGLRDRESADVLRLQEAVLEVARRMAAVEPALEEVEARASEGISAGDLEEVSERLDGAATKVDGFQAALAVGEARLDQLANAFDAAAARQEEANASFAERVDAATSGLVALQDAIAEIADRPAGDPALAARLDELAGRLGELADAGSVAELRASLEELAARPPGDPALAAELRAGLEELAARPTGDPALAAEVAALQERFATVADGSALDDLHASVAALTAKVDGLADLDALSELRATLDELAARPTSDAELVTRIGELAGRVDVLADTTGLEELKMAVAALSERPAGDPELAAQVAELATKVDGLADLDALVELRATLDEVAARPVSDVELTAQVAELSARHAQLADAQALEALRSDVAALAEQLAGLAGLEAVAELRATVEGLAGAQAPAADDELAARVAALARQVDELVPRDPSDPRVDELVDRLAALEESAAAAAAVADGASSVVYTAVEAQVLQLGETVAALAGDVANARAAHEALAARLERMPARQAGEGAQAAPADGDLTAILDQEVERLRMAIERMGLRLGEHDRALVELMQMRTRPAAAPAPVAAPASNGSADLSAEETGDLRSQVASLAHRLARAEEDARTDREKAFKEIERVASSLVWRLQRLETREGAPT